MEPISTLASKDMAHGWHRLDMNQGRWGNIGQDWRIAAAARERTPGFRKAMAWSPEEC